MAVEVIPTRNRVLVERERPKEETRGGIVIPDQAKDRQCKGVVLAVGPGTLTEKGDLRRVRVPVGARVIYSDIAGRRVKEDERDLLLLDEDDILAIVCEV